MTHQAKPLSETGRCNPNLLVGITVLLQIKEENGNGS